MIKLFQKFARCGAELHGLKPAQPVEKCSERGACAAGDSPGSGRGGYCLRAWNKKVVKYFKKLGNMRVLFYTRVVKYLARW